MAWAALAAPASASAQTAPSGWDAAGIGLKPSPALQENLPPEVRPQLPTFVSGDKINGQTDGVVTVEAETVDLASLRGQIRARGRHVSIEQMNDAVRRGGSRQ